MSGSIKWAPTLCTMCSVILSKERSRKTFILRSTTQTSSEWRTAPWFLLMPIYYTRFPLLSGLMDPPESLQGEGTRLPNSNSAEVFLSTGQPAAQSVCLPACLPVSQYLAVHCVCVGDPSPNERSFPFSLQRTLPGSQSERAALSHCLHGTQPA